MKHLVLWTGGLDSTALIHDLLRKDNHVTYTYSLILNNMKKMRHENTARRAMWPLLQKVGGTFEYQKPNIESAEHITGDVILPLSPFINNLINQRIHEGFDYISLGFTMGDDMISYLPELQKWYKSLQGFHTDKLPKLNLPLVKQKKCTSWYSLPENIRKHVYWCESNDKTNEPCGQCVPCKKMISLDLWTPKEKKNDPG